MSIPLLSLDGGYTLLGSAQEKTFTAEHNGKSYQVLASMWLEGLFEEDPGTFGLAGVKFALRIRRGGRIAVLDNLYLSRKALSYDYLPSGYAEGELEADLEAIFPALLAEGLWKEFYSAPLFATEGLRGVSRGFPMPRYLSELGGTPEGLETQNRFYHQVYSADSKGNPVKTQLRWYTVVYDENATYGHLACIHDPVSREYRLLDRSRGIPESEGRRLFERAVTQHEDFLEKILKK